jgi:hypothetical protein
MPLITSIDVPFEGKLSSRQANRIPKRTMKQPTTPQSRKRIGMEDGSSKCPPPKISPYQTRMAKVRKAGDRTIENRSPQIRESKPRPRRFGTIESNPAQISTRKIGFQ